MSEQARTRATVALLGDEVTVRGTAMTEWGFARSDPIVVQGLLRGVGRTSEGAALTVNVGGLELRDAEFLS